MDETHILIADDEKSITDYLSPFLERCGYRVTVAHDGQTALQKIDALHPNLAVLDVLMPNMNGREVCRELRAAGNWIPIIMLTRVTETVDKVLSLEEGADDYLCKPFDPQELIARIKTVLRRKQNPTMAQSIRRASRLRSLDVVLDRLSKRVEVGGRVVELTPKALALLEHLMSHPEQVFTREQLMEAVWGWSQVTASRAVDVRVAELRRALGDDPQNSRYIETVTGIGYRFAAPVEALSSSCD